ncbi:MAG TPA: methyltransferase domain-containing protein [Ktedonosporobacter sp.]|nr:methyltransferase domain-containing protein [Ktedonosporobacter sp.]
MLPADQDEPQAKIATPWWSSFFGEDYLRLYAPFLPAEKTASEVAGLLALLGVPTGCSLLDLGCGPGRLSLPLTKRGYQVTGLDLSERYLQQAQAESAFLGLQVRFVQGDMRQLPFKNEFHVVLNVFTSFGYFASEEEDVQVLQHVSKALKPSGLFLLDTLYQPKVLRTFSPSGVFHYDDGLVVLEERRIDLLTSRYEVHITLLHTDGHRTEYQQSIRLYTLTELARLLSRVGLELRAFYGSLDGSALSMESRLVVVAQKGEGSGLPMPEGEP